MSRDRVYGLTGFCCVTDSDMTVLWSNNRPLYRKMMSSGELAAALGNAREEQSGFEHFSTFEGVKYRTAFIPIPGMRYVGISYPEDRYVKSTYSQMYRRVFNMIGSSNRCLSALLEVKELLAESGVPEQVDLLLDEALGYTEDVLRDSSAAAELFDSEHGSEYVNISARLGATSGMIVKYNAGNGRNITFDIKLSHMVARINYLILECALFETARLVYKCLPEGGDAVIRIGEIKDGSLRFVTDVPLSDGFERSAADPEIRNILCAMESIGGSASFGFSERTLSLKAEVFAALSDRTERVLRKHEDGNEELRGYERFLSPARDRGGVVFGDEHEEYAVNISALLADIILSEVSG